MRKRVSGGGKGRVMVEGGEAEEEAETENLNQASCPTLS